MTYQIADQRHPFMGLGNKICKDDFDMVGTHRCGNLERNLMRVKYAKDIIKEIQARGSIQVPEGYITGEAFEEWIEGKERFGMSISEQVKGLREIAKTFGEWEYNRFYDAISQAADTIEDLSAKLAAANMERSDRYCGGGWIVCEDRLPDKDGFYLATIDGEIAGEDKPFSGLAEFENGKWIDDEEGYQCIMAWQPLPEPYRP